MSAATYLLRLVRSVTAIAILAIASCTPDDTAASDGDIAQLRGGAPPLARFYNALSQLEGGRTGRLTVVMIGDSHTAADHLSGRLRERLQGRFGNGGRGMLPPGEPFPYWRPYQVQVEQSGKWRIYSSNRLNPDPTTYGLSGFTLEGRTSNDTMSLTANDDATFDSVVIHTRYRPGGGRLVVEVDGYRIGEINTAGNSPRLERTVFTGQPGRRTLTLRVAGDGPVEIADWAIYRRERGVVLTSHGFPGATVNILGRWDWQTTAAELREMEPALILLAFGTNEGFAPMDNLGGYESEFESYVRLLQQAAPQASILIIGPPDADRLPDYCGGRSDQRDRRDCRALSASEAASYASLLSSRSATLCRWHPPAGIALVREAQRRVAQRLGVAFWDWSSVQGGACGADRWSKMEPPYGHKDRVHMRQEGYGLSADKLYDELLRGYRRR